MGGITPKELTGGESIPARFTHKDFFEYLPAFKPVISGNHKPRLRSVGVAMRRRVNMIPFAVTIPQGERDPDRPSDAQADAFMASFRLAGLPDADVGAKAQKIGRERQARPLLRAQSDDASLGPQSATQGALAP